jgi:hypothetical protein
MSPIKIISTSKYLQGIPVISHQSTPSNTTVSSVPTNMEKFLEEGGFVLTQPNGYKMSKQAFVSKRPRSGYPGCIKQIFLHHTATRRNVSNKSIVDIFNKRATPGKSKGSTHCSIQEDGQIERLFGEEFRAHAQGVSGKNFNTIGMSVEIVALGYLLDDPVTDDTGQVYYQQKTTHAKKYWVKAENVAKAVDFNGQEKAYRGKLYWEKYTPAQVNSTVKLVREWCTRYKIPFVFNQSAFDEMFPPSGKTSKKAFAYEKGVYSHNSVVTGKKDIYPDPLLVTTFKKEFGPGNSVAKF